MSQQHPHSHHGEPMPRLSTLQGAALLAEPDRLYAAWRHALHTNAHLHGPEAAALLGVPEAALLASATGRGNQALTGPLSELLAPVAQWGRVLVASRNGLGVKLDVLGRASFQALADGSLLLEDELHHIHLGSEGLARIDLFEEEDGHGRTLSLNWFDAKGDAVGRLFLMSKSGREEALPWLQRFVLPSAPAHWQPGSQPLPKLLSLDAVELGELPAGASAAAWGTAAILSCDAAPTMRLSLSGRGARSQYAGPLCKTLHTPPAAHATDLLCKLHARPFKAVLAQPLLGGGLQVADGDGGLLRFEPIGTEAAAWLDQVQQRALGLMEMPA